MPLFKMPLLEAPKASRINDLRQEGYAAKPEDESRIGRIHHHFFFRQIASKRKIEPIAFDIKSLMIMKSVSTISMNQAASRFIFNRSRVLVTLPLSGPGETC
jgi:hypothetical protein